MGRELPRPNGSEQWAAAKRRTCELTDSRGATAADVCLSEWLGHSGMARESMEEGREWERLNGVGAGGPGMHSVGTTEGVELALHRTQDSVGPAAPEN